MARTDTKLIERNVINPLFSPKVVKKIVKDDREIEYDVEMSNLNSIILKKRIFMGEERHLPTANINNNVPDQWGASRILADQWGTSNYEQVHDSLIVSNDLKSCQNEPILNKPKSQLSPQNPDLYVPKGGEPPLGPKIERLSQEIVSPDGGTPPPLTQERFLMEHLKPSLSNKKN